MSKEYAVVTGASGGIGAEVAKRLSEKNYNLILVARDELRLTEVKEEILNDYPKTDIVIFAMDLSIVENCHNLYLKTKDYVVKLWVNNAGFGDYHSLDKVDLDKIEKIIDLNVKALSVLSALYVKDYIDDEGATLINVSSVGGYSLVPNATTYVASKYYVSAFSECLYYELREKGAKIRVKVLAPAAVQTSFGKVANDVDEYDYNKRFDIYHTAVEMSEYFIDLLESDFFLGKVDRESYGFYLLEPQFKLAKGRNQKIDDFKS